MFDLKGQLLRQLEFDVEVQGGVLTFELGITLRLAYIYIFLITFEFHMYNVDYVDMSL